MNIKICGIRNIENANAAIEAGATHIGLVFFKDSPRGLSMVEAAQIDYFCQSKHLRNESRDVKTVMVTVDPSDEFLREVTSAFKPNYIQLHGAETPARAAEIKQKFGLGIIKAISVKGKNDLQKADEYINVADYILFDSRPVSENDMPGGNARSFDWKILQDFSPKYKWILSGGLNPENVGQAISITNASFVDVSSGVETSPGIKNNSLIRAFIRASLA